MQILALQKQKQANARFLAGLDTSMLKSSRGKDGFLRYYLGDFATPEEAEAFLQQNEKGSPLPPCFYAPPGRVGRAEALKKQVLLFLPLRKENPLARSEKIVILH